MPIRSYTDIHGWFFWEDTLLFTDILASQVELGTLVELGAFLGRSTALMGYYRRPDEAFVVVDLFGLEPEDAANAAENVLSYSNVDPASLRAEFESNYGALHDRMPLVVQAMSTEVAQHVDAHTVRFAHVDASHLYTHVASDLAVMRDLMQPDGVIVFDDYRAVHTPGVAAAVWEGVANHDLVPFALSPYKMYATWGDPARHLERAWRLGSTEPDLDVSREMILGHDVVRLEKTKTPAHPTPRMSADEVDAVARAVADHVAGSVRTTRSRSDWAPPVVVEWVRARRQRRSTS